jgi:hypothetical protein
MKLKKILLVLRSIAEICPFMPSGNTSLTNPGLPENDLCGFFCYFPGE